jgi:anti-sigma-K factor RskA
MIRQNSISRTNLVKKGDHVLELLPEYILNGLGKLDNARVTRHVKKCAECKKALADYQTTFDCMVQAVPMTTPKKDLRDRVIENVKAGNRRASDSRHLRIFPPTIRNTLHSLFSNPIRMALSISVMILIVVLAINNLSLYNQVNELKAFLPGSDVHLFRLMGTTDAPHAVGYLMVFSDGKAGTLAVKEAPVLESGFQYQVWLIQQGQGVSGGMFNVNENGYGTLEIKSSLPLEDFDGLDITKEPKGGSAAPTGGKILAGGL